VRQARLAELQELLSTLALTLSQSIARRQAVGNSISNCSRSCWRSSSSISRSGSGAINANGTWSANGKNQEFGMKVEKGTPIDSKDRIAEKILEGMKKANSYKGSDSRNLYLYYQTDKENLCLVFAPN
jgi:hypothetical protein